MPMILNGKISGENFDQDYYEFTHYFYKVDETLVRVPIAPAWCASCMKIVDSELLPSIQAIDERIRRFKSGELDRFLNLDDEKRTKEIEKLVLFKSIRSERVERAKCLECSGIEITVLNEPNGYLPKSPPGKTSISINGETKEMLLYLAGHININKFNEVILDKNGNRA